MIPKQQHWVPRFYLSVFATPETVGDDNPQVWLLSKDDGDPVLTNVKNVASKRYLYSPKDEQGRRSGEVESRFADYEGLMKSIWPILAKDFVDLENDQSIRKALALFVSLLYLRHPKRLVETDDIHRQIVEKFDAIPKDRDGCPSVSQVGYRGVSQSFDNSNWHQYAKAGPEEKKEMFVKGIKENATYLAEMLMKKRWSVVFSETPVFITTDTPVWMAHQTQQVYGFGTPGTMVSFPLSPTRVLVMDDRHDQPKGNYYSLAKAGPGFQNGLAWRNCYRFMISPRHPDEVCAEILATVE